MENMFVDLRNDELQNVEGGDLLAIAIVVLGAVDILMAGYTTGFILGVTTG